MKILPYKRTNDFGYHEILFPDGKIETAQISEVFPGMQNESRLRILDLDQYGAASSENTACKRISQVVFRYEFKEA